MGILRDGDNVLRWVRAWNDSVRLSRKLLRLLALIRDVISDGPDDLRAISRGRRGSARGSVR